MFINAIFMAYVHVHVHVTSHNTSICALASRIVDSPILTLLDLPSLI